MQRPIPAAYAARHLVRSQRTSSIATVLAAAAVAAGAGAASAADVTWDGGGATTLWTDGNNWVGNVAPVAGDALRFGPAPVFTSTNNFAPATPFAGVSFDADAAGSHVLNGANPITLGGNINNLVAGSGAIQGPFTAGAAQTINFGLILGADRTIGSAWQGNLHLNGAITGNGFGITKTGLGHVVTTAANTYTGTTSVRNGTFTVDASANGTAAVSPFSRLNLGWGTFRVVGNGATVQPVNDTLLGTGYATIAATNATINLGELVRSNFGTVNFAPGAGGTINTYRTNGFGTILAPWAVVNGNTWATSAADGDAQGAVTGLTTYSNAFTSGADVDVNATGITSTDPVTINSLRVSAAGTTTVGALTIESGGILIGAPIAASTLAGTSITSGSGELVIIANHPNNSFDISARLTGTMGLTLTGAGNGGGRVSPTNTANDFVGPINLVAGRLTNVGVTSNGQLGNTANVVIVHGNESGGGQFFQGNVALPSSRRFQIAGFGWAETGGSHGALRVRNAIAGTVTLSGDARIGSYNNMNLSGKVSGPHALYLANGTASNNFTLSNATNDWSGGTVIERGRIVLGHVNGIPQNTSITMGTPFPAGDPYRPVGANVPTLDLNGQSPSYAGVSILAGDAVAAGARITNNHATGATSTITFDNAADFTFGGVVADGNPSAGVTSRVAVTKAGAAAATLAGANTYTGDTNINGGTLVVGAANHLGASSGPIGFGGGTLRLSAPVSFARGALVGAGGGTLDTNGFDGSIGAVTGAGGFTKAGAGTLAAARVKLTGPLAITGGGGGALTVAPDGTAAGMVEATGLSLAGGNALRLNDNDLLVNYTGPSPEAAVRQLVKNSRTTGSTSGIFSTPGSPDDDKVLAIADNLFWGKSAFNGVAIDADTVVGKYTYFGDANLDGKVTGDDYLNVDANLGTGDSWLEGDFNMSGQTSGDDYLAIDANLGKGTADPLAFAEMKDEMVALHVSMFGEAYLVKLAQVEAEGFGASVVPEPAAISLIGLGAIGLLGRRRRKV